MKKVFVPALLAVVALALDGTSVRAEGFGNGNGCGFGYCSSSSGHFCLNFKPYFGCPPCCPPGGGGGGGGGYGGAVQLGPWYNYWPLEAHFQTPALPQYPYWPAPQAYFQGGYAPPQAPVAASPGYLPSPNPAVYSGQGYANPYHTASYPAYWYGR